MEKFYPQETKTLSLKINMYSKIIYYRLLLIFQKCIYPLDIVTEYFQVYRHTCLITLPYNSSKLQTQKALYTPTIPTAKAISLCLASPPTLL